MKFTKTLKSFEELEAELKKIKFSDEIESAVDKYFQETSAEQVFEDMKTCGIEIKSA